MTDFPRRGDWMCTYTGRQFWPMDPRPDEIDIVDIAHALSNLCRFGGHCKGFYSVAQHSVYVSRHVPAEDRMWGLLHDAPEAYLVDLPRPIKNQDVMVPYRLAEAVLMSSIVDRFGLGGMPESVREADEIMLATEARDLMDTAAHRWTLSHEPQSMRITDLWEPKRAETTFLDFYANLLLKAK